MARTKKETIVPSSPEDLKKISGVVREIVNAQTRIRGEREYIKEAIAELCENYTLSPKDVRLMVKDMDEGTFDERVGQFETYQELFTKVKSAK